MTPFTLFTFTFTIWFIKALITVAALTCGCSSGSRMWASSEGRWRSRVAASWPTHVSKEVTTVSSSGTLTSSDVSSLSISSTGSNRNSWPPTTSKKCSWWADGWNDYKRREGKSRISLKTARTNEWKNLQVKKGMRGGKKTTGTYEWRAERDWGRGGKRKEMKAYERSKED